MYEPNHHGDAAFVLAACSDAGAPAGPEGISAAQSDIPASDGRQIVVFHDGVSDVHAAARRLTAEFPADPLPA